MIYKINGENPFQVLSDSFSVSPSESGYQLQISADGKNYTNFATVAANTTKQFTGMNNGNFYRLSGNTSEVTINWMRECKSSGGSGGGSGSTVTWNQIVTGGTKIAEISIDGASTDVYAPEGGTGSEVSYSQTLSAGTEVGQITIDGSATTIYAPSGSTYELPIASSETLGGVKVGSGLTIDANGVLSASGETYELPTAAANTLGGVKVGSGLSIDANGVLSTKVVALSQAAYDALVSGGTVDSSTLYVII